MVPSASHDEIGPISLPITHSNWLHSNLTYAALYQRTTSHFMPIPNINKLSNAQLKRFGTRWLASVMICALVNNNSIDVLKLVKLLGNCYIHIIKDKTILGNEIFNETILQNQHAKAVNWKLMTPHCFPVGVVLIAQTYLLELCGHPPSIDVTCNRLSVFW